MAEPSAPIAYRPATDRGSGNWRAAVDEKHHPRQSKEALHPSTASKRDGVDRIAD